MAFSKYAVFHQRNFAQYLLPSINWIRYVPVFYKRSLVEYSSQLPWLEVKKEMTEEKGLDPAVADKIGEYVKHKGTSIILIPSVDSDLFA